MGFFNELNQLSVAVRVRLQSLSIFMVESSNSFYTVEGSGTFWNMVEHCGTFRYHMHGITQQALLCSALHCFPQLIYNWVGNHFIMDFLFLFSLFSIKGPLFCR